MAEIGRTPPFPYGADSQEEADAIARLGLTPLGTPQEAYRLLDSLERVVNEPPPRLAQNLSVECWTYLAAGDEVPAALRQIADRLDEVGGAPMGLWSTGFGKAHQAVLQVIVDTNRGATDE